MFNGDGAIYPRLDLEDPTSAFAFRGAQEHVPRPFAATSSLDGVGFVRREPDLHGDGASLVIGERRSSGARVHSSSLAGYGKFRKMVDIRTFGGHNKNMTKTMRGTGQVCSCGEHRERCHFGHAHVYVFSLKYPIDAEVVDCARCGAHCNPDHAEPLDEVAR